MAASIFASVLILARTTPTGCGLDEVPCYSTCCCSNTSTVKHCSGRILAEAWAHDAALEHSDGWESHDYTEAWAKLRPEPPLCFPVPAVQRQVKRYGQIGAGTSFGTALHNLASQPGIDRVLEIGTFFGGGSTPDLASSIRDKPQDFSPNCVRRQAPDGGGLHKCCHSVVVTMEVFSPAWKHASQYLRGMPVWCVHGTTVTAEEMLQPSEISSRDKGPHFKLYYQRDRDLMQKFTPKLSELCRDIRFGLVLIDGNEYTGWAEFNKVRSECRPRYIALHDTQTLKTHRIEEFLEKNQSEYKLLLRKDETASGASCGLVGCKGEASFVPNSAGWAIYEKV